MGLKESGLRGSLRNVSVGIDAIPDTAVAHYDATAENTGSLTTITDQIGSFNLSGSCEVISNGISGKQTFRFDGSVRMSTTDVLATGENIGILMVVKQQEATGSNNFYFGTENVGNEFSLQDDDSNELDFRRGESGGTIGESATTDAQLLFALGPGDDGIRLERNGNVLVDKTESAGDINGLNIASTIDGQLPLEVDFGEIVVLEDFSEDDIDSEYERLSDKWDIQI